MKKISTPLIISSIVVLTIIVVGFVVYYFIIFKQNISITISPSQQTTYQQNSKLKSFDNFSIVSDQKLFEDSSDFLYNPWFPNDSLFGISYTTWSPNSDKLFVTVSKFGLEKESDLPDYLTYDIFDTKLKVLGKTNIKDGIIPKTPYWVDDNTLATEEKIANVANAKNIILKDNLVSIPDGYELLKNEEWVERSTFSPNKKYAAFFNINNVAGVADELKLFIMPQGAKSLNEIINLGLVSYGIDMIYPAINWSRDSRYIIISTGGELELFDVSTHKAILPYKPEEWHLIYLSPDESKALIIAVLFADPAHETERIYIKDLINKQEITILSAESSTGELDIDGSFSPDGKYIVFNSNKQLWIANTATGEKTQLTTEAKNYSQPRWSNDGKKIVYSFGKEIRLIELSYQVY